jgi:hypothetical protein
MRLWLIVGLVAGLLVAWAAARWRRWRGYRRSLRGRRLEAAAPAALTRAGYRVIAHGPTATYPLSIDGEPRTMRLEGDYLVARGRRRYVVEVKSGQGADPARRGTRRQLLEYSLGFEVDGVLLFDAERGRLHHVEFPTRHRRRAVGVWFVVGIAVGAGLAALWLH